MTNAASPHMQMWRLLVAVSVLLFTSVSTSAEDGSCAACSCNGDRDGDGVVTVDEVVAAVNNLLEGCPPLLWQPGCGGPIPGFQTCPATVDFCTTQTVGESCNEAGVRCCVPGSQCLGALCNEPLVCSTGPELHCPISRRAFKRDIEYLGGTDIDDLRRQLLAFKLARYRYRSEPPSSPAHLGFIIDDIEPSPAVGARGDAVDLYGYLSMAVATVQAQSNDIDALKREVNDLRKRLNDIRATTAEQSQHSVKHRVAAHDDPVQR